MAAEPSTTDAVYALPLPPEGGPNGGPPCEKVEDLMESLNSFAKANGYCLVRRQASNYHDGKPTRYYVYCDRSSQHVSHSRGVRRATTRKSNCPFVAAVKANKSTDYKWVFELRAEEKYRTHNHDVSSAVSHAHAHRFTEQMEQQVRSMASVGISPMDIHATLKSGFPDHPVDRKDIYNFLQRNKRTPDVGHSQWKCDKEGSYLITGGSTGLGRAMLQWLADEGAQYLIVPQRLGVASPAAATTLISELRNRGVTVLAPTYDPTSASSLSNMLKTCGQDMPPIRGYINAAMALQVRELVMTRAGDRD